MKASGLPIKKKGEEKDRLEWNGSNMNLNLIHMHTGGTSWNFSKLHSCCAMYAESRNNVWRQLTPSPSKPAESRIQAAAVYLSSDEEINSLNANPAAVCASSIGIMFEGD